ncbi:hypothetical protein EIN_117330 [Entamoeba invadens IP1]|uniref:Leucine rich repeat containing protein BspA family protein n=1 Tax=Entamoeba invadens IP1 TaxID=370355 RepID=L7FNG1_ENTIV|nr:hypothetical protein EIN_117330 [Entamoeba invadens IP1]ELP92209.1 hypothetical protein EIN_117330 [Entamoeba invadens IP1]|eukprot:XP_004258980.1 hypothetical protein EIN_117330 [Entamoeba invadens IP1]
MSCLDSFHIMIVSQYFSIIDDFISLEFVCKKCQNNMEKFHNNPVQINTKTIKYFPNIETLNLWTKKDENFGNDIFDINTSKSDKIDFFQINVWFAVDYTFMQNNKNTNILCKNVIYTREDRQKYGDTIPRNIKIIGANCYYGSEFTSFVIPNSVTLLQEACFCECRNLKEVHISDFILSLPPKCFFYNESLLEIILPSTMKSIGDECCCGCTSLSCVDIPSCVSVIGKCAFNRCLNVKSVVVRRGDCIIEDNCFEMCCSLTSVSLQSSISCIGKSCFGNCNSLSVITLPKCLKYIPNSCFFKCGNLIEIEIPNGITKLCKSCFYECEKLVRVVLPQSIKEIDCGAFVFCSSLKGLEIPHNVTKVGDSCCFNCLSLRILIPSTLKSIGVNSFTNCDFVEYENKCCIS